VGEGKEVEEGGERRENSAEKSDVRAIF